MKSPSLRPPLRHVATLACVAVTTGCGLRPSSAPAPTTLNMVRSLSGYVTTADGRPLIFSLLANHFTVPTRDIDALHDAIVVRLAQMRGGR